MSVSGTLVERAEIRFTRPPRRCAISSVVSDTPGRAAAALALENGYFDQRISR
jgi:hypothetical protein